MTADFNLASVEHKKSLIYTRPFDSHILRAQQRQQKGGPSLGFCGFLVLSLTVSVGRQNCGIYAPLMGFLLKLITNLHFHESFLISRPPFHKLLMFGQSRDYLHFRAIVWMTLCCCDRQQFCFRLISGCRSPPRSKSALMFQLFGSDISIQKRLTAISMIPTAVKPGSSYSVWRAGINSFVEQSETLNSN